MLPSRRNVLPITALLLLVVSSRLSKAQITFTDQSYSLTTRLDQVIVQDFNHDAKPDLAALSLAGGTVSILLNNGDGTFATPLDFPAGTNPPADFPNSVPFPSVMAAGDFNGDGKLDIAVINPGDAASINILLGNGDGAFQSPRIIALDFSPDLLAGVGYLNGDKRTDVVVHVRGDCSLVTLLGNADGTFTRESNFPTPCQINFITAVMADFNQDGRLDLAFSDDANIVTFLGKGDGTFQTPLELSSPAPSTFFLSTGDLDRDSKPDLVSTSFQSQSCPFGVCHPVGPPGSLAILPGHGDGTFGGKVVVTPANFRTSAVGDFDGDGNPDLIVTVIGPVSTPSNIYLGDGHANFAAPLMVSLSGEMGPAADLNGDGLADVVLTESSTLHVAINTTPTFSLEAAPSSASVNAGSSATYAISVGQKNGFTVALSCSVPAVTGVHCSLSPSSVTPASNSTLTVTTAGSSAASLSGTGRGRLQVWLYAFWLPVAFVVGGSSLRSRQLGRQKWLLIALGSMLFVSMIFQVACGGGSETGGGGGTPPSTPPGTYTITVTATAGTIQHSTNVSLTVK